MSHKGYIFESEIEDFFLALTNQKKKDPILKTDHTGMIRVNRTFRIPTSGAMESMKGDVLTAIPWLPKQMKVECKNRRERTKKDGPIFSIEIDWIEKNNAEAAADRQLPVLTLKFKRTPTHRVWWLMRERDFRLLAKPLTNTVDFELKQMNIKVGKTRIKLIHSEISKDAQMTTIFIKGDTYFLIPHHVFSDLMKRLKNV